MTNVERGRLRSSDAQQEQLDWLYQQHLALEEQLDWMHQQHTELQQQTALLRAIRKHTGLVYGVLLFWVVLSLIFFVLYIINLVAASHA